MTLLVEDVPNVVGRYVFYNDSDMDGMNPGANENDDLAIDYRGEGQPTIEAWLDGEPFDSENHIYVSGYTKGLNGIMVDVSDLADPVGLAADDFTFEYGDGQTWLTADDPAIIDVRELTPGADVFRVTLIWNNESETQAVKNDWLRVTVLDTEDTGLISPDIFCFGSLIGDASGDGVVNGTDLDIVRDFWGQSDKWLYQGNLDMTGIVGGNDMDAVRGNWGASLPDPSGGERCSGGGGGGGGLYTALWESRVDAIFEDYDFDDEDSLNELMADDELWEQFTDELFGTIESPLSGELI